jgi:hypothetical protein
VEPAQGTRPVAEGIYAEALRILVPKWSSRALILEDSLGSGNAYPVDASLLPLDRTGVPGFWADTVRHEVAVAMRAPQLRATGDGMLITMVASTMGIKFLRNPSTIPAGVPFRVWLSQPGFNADSTVAALRSCVEHRLCGTLLFARRPGLRWLVWYPFTYKSS